MDSVHVLKCTQCGCTEVDEDDARGDKVCVGCGSVLEDTIVVSEVQFEEKSGRSALVGKFVPIDGGASRNIGQFNVCQTAESHQKTLQHARHEISKLCEALRLNDSSSIEGAFQFYRLALNMGITRGRKNAHVFSACVYMVCRTKRKELLLIDISDVQQICSYELGRTFIQLANKLCIKIPAIDPCLYVMRFANRLDFGAKTRDVSNTATRIVTRMMKDSLHSGRRPTGLCGAALLIAARMHDFNRTLPDIVSVVKIHESTLRKRLTEFSDTPSSGLTVEEFMSVDLEQQQDPPAYKAAREKDKKRINQAGIVQEVTKLQNEIEQLLEKELNSEKRHKTSVGRICTGLEQSNKKLILEGSKLAHVIEDSNLMVIKSCMNASAVGAEKDNAALNKNIAPDLKAMCRVSQAELDEISSMNKLDIKEGGDLFTDDLDDEELGNYMLSENEVTVKNQLWSQLNAEYLAQQKLKLERLEKEALEGKAEKKRTRRRKKDVGPTCNAIEAMEKMLMERNVSSRLNYDVLRLLSEDIKDMKDELEQKTELEENYKDENSPTGSSKRKINKSQTTMPEKGSSAKKRKIAGLPVHEEFVVQATATEVVEQAEPEKTGEPISENETDILDDFDESENEEAAPTLYNSFRNIEEEDEYGYGYDDEIF